MVPMGTCRPRPPDSRRDLASLRARNEPGLDGVAPIDRSACAAGRTLPNSFLFGCRPDLWTRAEFLTRCGLGPQRGLGGATSLAGGLARVKNGPGMPAPRHWRGAQVHPRVRRKSLRPDDCSRRSPRVRPTTNAETVRSEPGAVICARHSSDSHSLPDSRRRVQLAVEDRSNCMTTMARPRRGHRGGAIAVRRRHIGHLEVARRPAICPKTLERTLRPVTLCHGL